MEVADDQAGLASHGGVRGVPRKQIAQDRVFRVGFDAPD